MTAVRAGANRLTDGWVALAVGASVLAGWLVTIGPDWIRSTADHALAQDSSALVFGVVGGGAFLVLGVRALATVKADLLLSRLAIYGYFALLFLGVAALSALRLFKSAAWPIAATQTLPTTQDATRAFWMGLAGGVLIVVGAWMGARVRSARSASDVEAGSEGWDQLRVLAPVFAAVGALGVAVIVEKTHEVVLFASNVDRVRFTQGSGLGYASLLEYEFLLAACIAGAMFASVRRSRRAAGLLFVSCLGALVLFRAERTPVLVAVGVALFAYVVAGGRHRGRIALLLIPALVSVILALGLFRLQSSSVGPLGRQREVVRAVYDVSPEFREASFVYQIYPAQTPFIGSRAVLSDFASVLPSGALRLVGVNKSSAYTDISHEYSATMQRLAIYPAVVPLRVGLGAELWADFGIYGFALGLLGYGLLVGWVGASQPRGALSTLKYSIAGVLLLLALVTPTAALLPMALMLLGPLALLGPLGVVSQSSRATGQVEL